ncbi:MAG: tetratricopeptide repeat protein [Flavobacteriaceae bacterium]|nr:tetratricopeptide repeat protein [Flavobacteriaceae bacterium]
MNIAISKISGILKKVTKVLIIALAANLLQAQTTINADSLSGFKNLSLRAQLGIPNNGALLNLSAKERRNKLKGVNFVSITNYDKDKIVALLNTIQLFAKQQGDSDLALEMELLNLKYNLSNLTPEFRIQRLLELDSITEANNKPMQVQFKCLLGLALMNSDKFSEGIYQLFYARYLLRNGISDPEVEYNIAFVLGGYAYKKQRFNMSKFFFKEAINTKFNSEKALSFNNLGLVYSKLGVLDSAYYYYKIAKEKAIVTKDSVMLKVVNGNSGEILYKQGELQAALPLIREDAEMCLSVNSYGNASNALVLLSDIYLQLGNNAKAETLLFQALANARKINDLRRMEPVYKQLSKWYAAKGNAKKTLIYADSASYVNNKLNTEFATVSGFDAETSIELNIRKVDLLKAKQLQEQHKQQIQKYIIILLAGIIVMSLLGIIVVLYIKREKLKIVKIQEEKTDLQGQLNKSRQKLDGFVKSMLKESLNANLTISKMYTTKQLDDFKNLFTKSYPGYLIRLKEIHANLTKSETLLFCFTLLNLPDNEISGLLGVNINSVRQTRSRVMRKLSINGINSFKTYVLAI